MKNGEIFTGSQAIKEGLVTSLDNVEKVWNEEFVGVKVVKMDQKKRRNWMEVPGGKFGLEEIEEVLQDGIEMPQLLAEEVGISSN